MGLLRGHTISKMGGISKTEEISRIRHSQSQVNEPHLSTLSDEDINVVLKSISQHVASFYKKFTDV